MAARTLVEVEVGAGEGSFFGLKLEPGFKYRLLMKADMRLANLALDPSTVTDLPDEKCDKHFDEECEGTERGFQDAVGLRLIQDGHNLLHHHVGMEEHQYRLDLNFSEGDEITLYVKGNVTYYICGYKNCYDYGSN